WSRHDEAGSDERFRRTVGTHLLRIALSLPDQAGVTLAGKLLREHPLVPLAGAWVRPGEAILPPQGDGPSAALARLWKSAVRLEQLQSPEDRERWRMEVRELRSDLRVQPLAQCLLVQEAARSGDAGALVELLQDDSVWHAFPAGPPRFVARAVAGTVR